MILYLLFPALTLGIVESQPADHEVEKQDEVGRNQAFNSTIKPEAVTSRFYEDKKKIEDELQSKQTSLITEDEESFQDEEYKITGQNCYQEMLIFYSRMICGKEFHQEMLSIGMDNWCVLEHVIRPYSNLTTCLETVAKLTGCFFPNPDIQDFFIFIHSSFFQNCTNEHVQALEDAPQGLVIGLTLLSVSFIPILVYLVARS